jgi:hypothetical protein
MSATMCDITPRKNINEENDEKNENKDTEIMKSMSSSQRLRTFHSFVIVIFSALSVLYFKTKYGIKSISGNMLPNTSKTNGKVWMYRKKNEIRMSISTHAITR